MLIAAKKISVALAAGNSVVVLGSIKRVMGGPLGITIRMYRAYRCIEEEFYKGTIMEIYGDT